MPRLDEAMQHRIPMFAIYFGVNSLLVALIALLAQGVASIATGVFVPETVASAAAPSRIDLHHAALERERQHRPAQHRAGVYALKDQGIPVAVLAAKLDVSERELLSPPTAQLSIAAPAMAAVAGFYTTAESAIEETGPLATASPNSLPADVIAELLAPQADIIAQSVEAAPAKAANRTKKLKLVKRGVAQRGRLAGSREPHADATPMLLALAKSPKLASLNGLQAKKSHVRRDSAHDILSRNMNAYAMAVLDR